MITPSEVARLALDLGKATFDNTFSTVSTVQEWIEDGVRRASRAVPLVPDQVVAVVDETVGLLARTRADFKQTVDRCYHLVSDLLGADEPAPTAAAPARARRAS